MKVTVAKEKPEAVEAALLAVPHVALDPEADLPGRLAELDRVTGGRIAELVRAGEFRGQRGEAVAVPSGGGVRAARLLLVGLGDEASVDAACMREAAAAAVRRAAQRGGGRVAVAWPASRRVRGAATARAVAEGAVLAGYRFDRYQTRPSEQGAVEALVLLADRATELRALRAAATLGHTLAEAQNRARDLSNEPPNKLSPEALARAARAVAKETGLAVRVLDAKELERRGFGAMLAVAGGSARPPRLIVLEHNAPGRARGARKGRARSAPARRRPTVCLVGKGVCFDSGGLSLKPSTSMVKMKHDMSGGAVVIAALGAVARLGLPLHVVGVVGAVENMPSGTAYRVDDVLTSLSGQTIEVANTDAEGRLVLADCLHYACSTFEPDAVVDLATLTGACAIALGPWAAAVLSNHEGLSAALRKAGEATDERYWPLPLWDVHREHMKSQIADLKQTGGRDAGTTTAAAFLSHFVGSTPWAHLDIASVSDTDKATSLQPPGATGFGVRSVVELLRGWGRKGPL